MAAKIISLINQKGGCGKTTITMNLAATLSLRHNKKVLVIDGDTQSSATSWANCAADDLPFPCHVISLASAAGKAHRSIVNFIADYDVIIIDCPPSTETEFSASALLVSDLAIIPVKPSSTDLWAISGILKLISAAAMTNEKLVSKIVPNMCEPNKRLSQSIINYCKNDENINLFKCQVNNRSVYGEVALAGESVYTSKNSKAKNEIALLTDEVLTYIM
ncbi:MAG: ParA family protein [Burkholderiales bacterium]|jgi:chromosome partitioning protein|nr:ParA family protein [Burkholderiales bacterium]